MANENDLFAFLSYRRADGSALAKWLRRRIEKFKLPAEIVEHLSVTSKRIYENQPKVFIDVSNEKPSEDFLKNKIYPNLDRAKNLVVISTPEALKPRIAQDGTELPNWLELEVDHYLGSNNDEVSRPVFVVLGPNASKSLFPGRLNANPHRDFVEFQNANAWHRLGLSTALDKPLVKLIVGLYDIPEQLLPLVYKEEQQLRTRQVQIAATAASVIAVLLGSLAVYAFNQQSIAETQSQIAIDKTKSATAAYLGSEALRLSQSRFDLAALLAVEAKNIDNGIGTRRNLLDVLASNPYVKKYQSKHKGEASALAFSEDNKYLVSGDSNGALVIWDVETQESITSDWHSGPDSVSDAIFAPNTPLLAVSGSDENIQLWDISDPQFPAQIESKIKHPELTMFQTNNSRFRNIQSIAFSPDGALLATGGDDNNVRIWRMPEQTLLQELTAHNILIKQVAFTPDGSHLVVGDDDWRVSLWRVDSTSLEEVVAPVKSGHSAWILSLGISENNLVVTGAGGGSILGRNIDDFTDITVEQSLNASRIYGLDFIHNGETIVFGNDAGEVAFIDHNSGRIIGNVLRAHRSGIRSLAATSNGNMLVTGARDGTLVFWDVTNFDRTGLTTTDNLFKRELVSKEVYAGKTPEMILTMALSPDGSHVYINDPTGAVRVINSQTWQQTDFLLDGHSDVVRAIAFSKDGEYMATSGKDMVINLRDSATTKIVQKFAGEECAPTGQALDMNFSADGQVLQTTHKVFDRPTRNRSQDAVVALWDVSNGRNLACLRGFQWHGTDSEFIPWVDDYSLVAGSWDQTLRMWSNPISPSADVRMIDIKRATVYATDFSNDGKHFALSGVAGNGGGQLSIWDVRFDDQIVSLDNQRRFDKLEVDATTETITRVKFSNDGKILATASKDGSLTLWDSDSGKL